jgi:hypothetical protein
MPWHPGRTSIEATWAEPVCRSYRHICDGKRNAVDATFTGTDARPGRLDGFISPADAAAVLTHPLDGLFSHPSGRLGRYSVWHPRLEPTVGVAERASYAVFERFGLIELDAEPHSVLLQPSVEFDVHLPPT